MYLYIFDVKDILVCTVDESTKNDFNIIFLVMIGLSILQNGKMPNFISEEIIQHIFAEDDQSSPCILQLRLKILQLRPQETWDISGHLAKPR